MTSKLSDEQRQALAQQPGESVKMDVFEQMQRALGSDASQPDPREFAPMMRHIMKEDWDAPGMDVYDDYRAPNYDTPTDAP